jgi:hypothetical protein
MWVIALLLACAAPTTAPLDQFTPKGALKIFAKALEAGDRRAILESLAATNDQERRIAAATAELAAVSAELRAATTKAFGAEPSRALGVDSAAAHDAAARIDSASATIDGDKATVRAEGNEGPPMLLVKRDGKWRVPVSELSKDVEAADIDKNLADVAAQIKVMRQVAADVAAGKYKSAVEARQALDERIVKGAVPATAPATKAVQ